MITLSLTQSQVKPFVAKDCLRPAMAGVYLDFTNNVLIATNGFVLLKHSLHANTTETRPAVVIPVGAFPKKTGGYTDISIEGNSVTVGEFNHRGVKIETRVVELIPEIYPNYQAVIPKALDKPKEPESLGRSSDEYEADLHTYEADLHTYENNRQFINHIGLDFALIADVSAAFKTYVKMTFHGPTAAILITPDDNPELWTILVMPTRLTQH